MVNFSVEALFKAAVTKKSSVGFKRLEEGRQLRRRGRRPMSARLAVDEVGRLW